MLTFIYLISESRFDKSIIVLISFSSLMHLDEVSMTWRLLAGIYLTTCFVISLIGELYVNSNNVNNLKSQNYNNILTYVVLSILLVVFVVYAVMSNSFFSFSGVDSSFSMVSIGDENLFTVFIVILFSCMFFKLKKEGM